MPLQIRRGTDAERQLLVPSNGLVIGELLYVTDTQQVYIGTGNPGDHQGIVVTGYTDENAVDAIGAALVAGTNTNISFTYGSTQDLAGRIDAAVDLSNYTGTITADAFKGTVVADDSTILVDAVSGTFNLNGTIKGDMVPNANETYDIGSASFKFKDLYLSGSSIYLGDAVITSAGSAVDLPAGSTINGVPLAIPGDTSLTVDITGSVFGDDSTMLVDAVSNTLSNGTIGLIENAITGSNSSTLLIQSPQIGNQAISFDLVGEDGNWPTIGVKASYGTIDSPTDQAVGDQILTWNFQGHLNGTFKEASSITTYWSASADTGSLTPDSTIFITTRSNVDEYKVLSFDHRGVLNVPIFKATGYATGSLPLTGAEEEGMMVFDSTTKEFKGFNGTSWVVLG
jgi:hypothetical protein